ncbi:MAG: hypothetical protein WC211_02860 [Dehalococcoidia bacterium]
MAVIPRLYTYVAFDGDADLMSYRLIQQWSKDPARPFTLWDAHSLNYARDDSLTDSIISQLKPRLDASRHVVLLVSDATARNRRGILEYEVNYAFRYQLPILCFFIGIDRGTPNTEQLWRDTLFPRLPPVVRNHVGDKYCTLSPFTFDHLTQAVASFDQGRLPNPPYQWYW